ncbi:MAG: DUF389 domain-containing protein [Bacteroidales bacterium]|nr:DUF389 domain-containing protein [Bacteroidales bacterium]
MSTFKSLTTLLKETVNVSKHIDTKAAAKYIKGNMVFKGPNVWILAISVVIASIGLNLNSIPVIIGAMLISPLMGPIYATGLALGTNDTELLREAVKNFLIMVGIALAASVIYFLITPLNLVNPTEIQARTNPTIYDVGIAFAGGLIGIFEVCRKDNPRGTVLSGVAIATALMPPLCTAGYGLANGIFSAFIGAMFLFCINFVFISLATYTMVKYFGFQEASYADEAKAKRTKTVISAVVFLIVVPSIWSAVNMIRYTNFENKVNMFIEANKAIDNVYIYDVHKEDKNGGFVTVHVTGGALKAETKEAMINSAISLGIGENQIAIREHVIGTEDDSSEKLMKGIYDRTDAEINRKEMQIRELEAQISAIRSSEIPYVQIAKEVKAQYPDITSISLSEGAEVSVDSLGAQKHIVAIAGSKKALTNEQIDKLSSWLKIRLNDTTVVVINHRTNGK